MYEGDCYRCHKTRLNWHMRVLLWSKMHLETRFPSTTACGTLRSIRGTAICDLNTNRPSFDARLCLVQVGVRRERDLHRCTAAGTGIARLREEWTKQVRFSHAAQQRRDSG
jgi:hypothetical protein